MKALAIVSSIFLFTAPALAADGDIAGDYSMKGKSLRDGGSGYAGNCTLKPNGKVYDVNCVNSGSGDKYVGKGLLRGDQFSLYLGEYLVVYKRESDGRLVGNWAHSNSDDYGEEILTPKKAASKSN